MTIIFVFLLSMCFVGFGLITASLSKSAGAATGISFLFILPQLFFGMFVPMNENTEMIGLFLPSFYTTESIRLIFEGTSIRCVEILINLAINLIFSVSYSYSGNNFVQEIW